MTRRRFWNVLFILFGILSLFFSVEGFVQSKFGLLNSFGWLLIGIGLICGTRKIIDYKYFIGQTIFLAGLFLTLF